MSRETAAVARMLSDSVPRDGVLVVHSGFKKLKSAGHRIEPMIEALAAHVGEGTLLMPTMSWRICTRDNPFFHELDTPSHVGAMPEAFRVTYATHRSLHPTHSVAALGKHAGPLTAEHHKGTTPCPAVSPYGLMRGMPAHVLMLDCGFERLTAIHLPEELLQPDLYLHPLADAPTFTLTDRRGGTHMMKLRGHKRLNRCFEKFEGMLAAKGKLKAGEVDGAPYLLCTMDDLLGEVTALMERDPAATLAPDGVATRLSWPR